MKENIYKEKKTKEILSCIHSGYGQERGSLVTKIYNNYWRTLDIILLESIPWYLPVYLHSVRITCGTKNIIPCE